MASCMTFFSVGNGDMTLIETNNNKQILVDCNVKKSHTDESTDDFNCVEYLLQNLTKTNGISYADALIVTHSDQDHCRGVKEHFNLCSPKDADSNKISIGELLVPARLLIDKELNNDDAKAIQKEAKRRLELFDKGVELVAGNRIQIIGYSSELKAYAELVTPAGKEIDKINGFTDYGMRAFILRPVKDATDNEDAGVNDASIALKLTFSQMTNEFNAFLGGDLTCDNWKEIINYNSALEIDILLAPHHCSWHSISNEDVVVGEPDEQIAEFLEKSKEKLFVVASCKEIKRNHDNPPSYRAKNFYIKHMKNDDRFKCMADCKDSPYCLKISMVGVSVKQIAKAVSLGSSNQSLYTPRTYG